MAAETGAVGGEEGTSKGGDAGGETGGEEGGGVEAADINYLVKRE